MERNEHVPPKLLGLKLVTAITFAIQFISFLLLVTPDDLSHPSVLTSTMVASIVLLSTIVLLPVASALAALLLGLTRGRSLIGVICVCGAGFEAIQFATMFAVNHVA